MPIYRNGNKINKIMRNGKEISKVYRGNKLVFQNSIPAGTVIWQGDTTGGNITLNTPISRVPNGIKVYISDYSVSLSCSYSGITATGYTSGSGGILSIATKPSYGNNTFPISVPGGSGSSGTGPNHSYLVVSFYGGSNNIRISMVNDTTLSVSGTSVGASFGGNGYYEQLNDPGTSLDDVSITFTASGSGVGYAHITKIVAY